MEQELSVKKNMLWNSFGSLVNLGCQWLMTVLIVRVADGYEAAGVFSLAMSVYGIFGMIAQYRMYTYQISDVSNENTVGEYLSFRLVTNVISLVLCVAYMVFTCSRDSWLTIILYGVYRSIALVIDVFHGCDQRHHRMDYIGISLSLQGVASLVLFLVVFVFSRSLELAVASMIVAVAVVGIAYDYPRTRRLEKIKLGISRKKTVYLLVSCFSIVAASAISSATPAVPRQVLSFLMGNEALGIYASVAAPVMVIQMGSSYIYGPLLGYYSERYYANDPRGLLSLMRKSLALILGVCVVCAVLLGVLGEFVLVLFFGESISPYVYLLYPLLGFALLTGLMWFLNDLLIALRNFKATLVGSIVPFVVAIVAMMPFVQSFGMNGVTFTGLLANGAGVAVMAAQLSLQLKKWIEKCDKRAKD